MIFIATVINYIDRTAFALLWPQMGEDLGMDNSDYALMLNIFMIVYAASKFLSGRLYDKIGTRIGFVVSIVVWSAAAAFHALARGIVSLSLVRGLLGLGEAGLWPGAVCHSPVPFLRRSWRCSQSKPDHRLLVFY